LLRHMEPVFALFNMPASLYDITRRYLYGISFGTPAMALFAVLRCYCEGLGRPLPITVISLLGLLLNAFFNYLLIYGKAGMPALGGAGCGWATAITLWCMLLLMLAHVLTARFFAPVRLLHERSRPRWGAMLRFLRLGLPIGIAVFFEVSVFCVVTIVISPLGDRVVAGHQIAFSVTSLFFMLPLSLALALTIRIGHAYGRRDIAAITLTRSTGLRTTALLAVASGIIITLFRYPITALYTQDNSVRALAADLLLFAAAYQVFDALQVAAAGCLRGLQDTRGPMVLTLVAYWVVALPVGYSLGLTLLAGRALGPYGLWTGLVAGLAAACVLLNWRLRGQLRQLPQRWADT
jgi:MATE family multidrug resistance protein